VKPSRFLLPLSWLYAAGVSVRNWMFDVGVFRVENIGVPVISVGNLSAGGTGKTPLVAHLARSLREQKRRVAIVSRGYGRKTKGYVVVSNGRQRCAEAFASGDEPAELAEKLYGVAIVVDEQRVRGAKRVVSEFGTDVVILDDGFQHRSLHRDIDIVVVTADELVEGSRLLPAGYRRETMNALQRADVIVISKCKDMHHFERAVEKLDQAFVNRIVGTQVNVTRVRPVWNDNALALSELAGKNVMAFSGIGSPNSFERTLAGLGVQLIDHKRFPDHHWYSQSDVRDLLDRSKELHPDIVVTTEKDYVRLGALGSDSVDFAEALRLHVVQVEVGFITGEQTLMNAINAVKDVIEKK
jgi:tetraacyldisaccharide 4'-kinase